MDAFRGIASITSASHTDEIQLVANEPDLAAAVVAYALNIIYLCASVFSPYLPATTESILEQLNMPFMQIPDKWDGKDIQSGRLCILSEMVHCVFDHRLTCPGHRISKAKYLFSIIPAEKAEEWRQKFGGTDATRKKMEEEAAAKAAKKAADKARKDEKKKQKRQDAAAQSTMASHAAPMEERSVEATAVQDATTTDAAKGPVNGVAEG